MFWIRKKPDPPEIATPCGVFVWRSEHGIWTCDDYRWRDDFIDLNYWGRRFDLVSLSLFAKVLGDLDPIVELALTSARDEIEGREHNPQKMTLQTVDIDPTDAGIDFELHFSFADWVDGNLGVHFRGSEVVSVCVDD